MADGALAARRPALTAALIAAAFPTLPADDGTGGPLLSDEEIAALLDRTLPADRQPPELWVFGYGSLMWRPELEFAEERLALLRGWHRRFCLWQRRGRGSRERPGLMLALDRGGACRGIAYRVTGDVRARIAGIWRREMRGNGYRPRWVNVATDAGPARALTFVANRGGDRYAGRLAEAEVARLLAQGHGFHGTCADYLLQTVERCAALGIHDPGLWRLQAMVAAHLAGRAGDG